MNIKNITASLIAFVFLQVYASIFIDFNISPAQRMAWSLVVTIEAVICVYLSIECEAFGKKDNKQ